MVVTAKPKSMKSGLVDAHVSGSIHSDVLPATHELPEVPSASHLQQWEHDGSLVERRALVELTHRTDERAGRVAEHRVPSSQEDRDPGQDSERHQESDDSHGRAGGGERHAQDEDNEGEQRVHSRNQERAQADSLLPQQVEHAEECQRKREHQPELR